MKCVILRRNALDYVEMRRNALDYVEMHKRVEIRGFTLLWGCNVARGKQSCSGETKLLGGEKLKVALGRQICSVLGGKKLKVARGRWLGGGCSGEKSCSEKVNLLWGEKACFRIILNICTGEDDIVLSGCKLVLRQAFSGNCYFSIMVQSGKWFFNIRTVRHLSSLPYWQLVPNSWIVL